MTKSLDFCNIEYHQNHLICIINEGVTLSMKKSEELIENALIHYKGKPFVYITNRVNSYAVDPEIYTQAVKINNLIGLAVVSKNHLALKNAEIEKLFFKKPFEIFKNLNDAKLWANTLIKNNPQLK